MKVTLQQIADISGVSIGTVDRALHNRGRIKKEVAERILEVAHNLGYIPSNSRRNPDAPELSIGVITFLANRDFAEKIKHGILQAKEELRHWKINVTLVNVNSFDEEDQLKAIDTLLSENISGLVIMPIDSDLIRSRLNQLTEENGIPVVTLNADIVGTKRLCYVGIDNRQGGQIAAEFMAKLTRGRGNILIITGYLSNFTNSSRVDGFMEVLKSDYPAMNISGVHCCFDDSEELQSIIIQCLGTSNDISGIFVVSAGQDGIEKAFHQLQIKERPFVIVYDNTSITQQALLNNSVDFIIDQNCFNQGYQAVYAMANYLTGQTDFYHKDHAFTDINIKTRFNI